MRRTLPIYSLLMVLSLASFGQNKFQHPLVTGLVGTIPAFSDNAVFDVEIRDNTSDQKGISPEMEKYGQILKFKPTIPPTPKNPIVSFSEGSNMPILDLSMGYFSNFPVKEISKAFFSKMPITELKAPKLIIVPKE